MTYLEKIKDEMKEEIGQFLFLCGDRDVDILLAEDKKNLINEFARLACIALVFDFRRMFLRIFSDIENYLDEFIYNLDAVTFSKLNEWMNEFILNIEYEKAQDLVRELWEERKRTLDRENFNVRHILGKQ